MAKKEKLIDLSPFPRETIEEIFIEGVNKTKHEGRGLVEIKIHQDGSLCIGEKKVILFYHNESEADVEVEAMEFRKGLEKKQSKSLNINVLYYILQHPELFLEGWKRVMEEKPLKIIFWDTIVQNLDSYQFLPLEYLDELAPFLYWEDGKPNHGWVSLKVKLDNDWASAIIES